MRARALTFLAFSAGALCATAICVKALVWALLKAGEIVAGWFYRSL